MKMTREDGFISAFFLLERLWQVFDDDAPELSELGSICSEMQPYHRCGFVPADPASFFMWKCALTRQKISPERGALLDEYQAFDALVELLQIYREHGFRVQTILGELHSIRDGTGMLSWTDWLDAIRRSTSLVIRYEEDSW